MPSYNPNASTTLPNSEEEAGLARERRRRRGKNYFLSLLPNPFGIGQRTVKISHYERQAPPPHKKPRRVTGRREGRRRGGRKAQEAEKIRSECPAF